VKIDEPGANILASEIFLNEARSERIADVSDVTFSNGNIGYAVDTLRWVNDVAVPKHQAVIHNSSQRFTEPV